MSDYKQSNPKKLHILRKKQYLSMQKYRLSFINKKTGYYYNNYTVNRNCPVCNSNKKVKIFKKEGGVYVRCDICTLVYLDPVFKDRKLDNYYINNADTQHLACIQSSGFYKSIYGLGIKSIRKHTKKKKLKILDIGCCSGFFLDMCKKSGWDTFGMELNKKDLKIAEKSHKVWSTTVEQAKIKEKFDVITFWDCFEHIKNSKKTLTSIKKLLNKNGLVFFQVPNSDSLAARILRDKCNMFDSIEHVNLFNVKSFKHLISNSDFKILNLRSVIDELQVTNNFLNYQDPYYGKSENSKKINFLNKKNIHDNYLGYKLQILIKKK